MLYSLASADGEVSKAELTFIKNVAKRLGIDHADLEVSEESPLVLDLPDREYKVYALFHRLAIILMVDNVIDEAERKFCFNLGIQMGLHPNAVGEIIDYTISRGAWNADAKEVMDIFRKYLS